MAEWESEPLVACAVIVAEPGAVAMLAPTTIVVGFAFEVILKGLAGLVATPDGSPESVTCTVPEKPFFGVTDTVADCGTPPWVSARLAGEIETTKSGVAADVGGGVALGASCVDEPPPQAAAASAIKATRNTAMNVLGWALGAQRAAPLQMLDDVRTAVPLRWVDGSRAVTLQSYVDICQVDKYY